MIRAITSILAREWRSTRFWVLPLIGVLLAVAATLAFWPVDPFDTATVVRVCYDGTLVFRMQEGEFRVRAPGAWHSYRAAGGTVCQ